MPLSEWKHKPQHNRKYLQNIYVIRDLNLESAKDTQNLIRRNHANQKKKKTGQNIWIDTLVKHQWLPENGIEITQTQGETFGSDEYVYYQL